ncbi:MAG: hypothetical protein IPL65_00105 [Lewinellaceae bacterium]|nr:hypothetical protein [Lewinellaceae bacterium]
MKHTIFLVAGLSAFLACQSAPKNVQRNMNIYLRYMQEEDRFRAEAFLEEARDQQAMAPVDIPGGITYASKPMALLPVKQKTYFLEATGGFVADQPFQWKNEKGEAQQFVIGYAPMLNPGFGASSLDRSKPVKFSWQGAPLGKGEDLVFLWTCLDNGENQKMDIISPGSTQEIEFPAAKISQLSAGKWAYYVVRRKLVKAKVDDLPVSAVVEFYSKTDTLTLH